MYNPGKVRSHKRSRFGLAAKVVRRRPRNEVIAIGNPARPTFPAPSFRFHPLMYRPIWSSAFWCFGAPGAYDLGLISPISTTATSRGPAGVGEGRGKLREIASLRFQTWTRSGKP